MLDEKVESLFVSRFLHVYGVVMAFELLIMLLCALFLALMKFSTRLDGLTIFSDARVCQLERVACGVTPRLL